ncbi:leucine--tRNA ligase [Methanopyrus sp. SNP6]|uniref:leucine--tRNA ligase n=1 Tax=Methanopyrus sp. SNP6 TaxID=1937005 RepID=UPI001EFFAA5E|nr:leucine--tRNA ligase [Methanopyrus sp. SNP6]
MKLAERPEKLQWKEWEEAGLFEADPDDRESVYITVAYPYPSGSMHVGHARTYLVPDIYARFKRMQGYNVLFPMAFHVTGTPVVGIAERIKEGDEDTIRLYRDLYGVPEEELEEFTKPEAIVEYFAREYEENMKRMGYSIDWRRKFTTVDPEYRSFITWQYLRLKEKGLVDKGEHPVRYCPYCENPVGDHDLLEGEDATIEELTLVKFPVDGDDMILVAATFRPETLYGATNVWVKPDEEYLIVEVDGERWVVSEEAYRNLKHQKVGVEKVGKVRGEELIGEKVVNPITGEALPVLPAEFIDPKFGTGVVYSVPAHAPADAAALEDLRGDPSVLEEYGVDPSVVEELEPVQVIEVEGYGEFPAYEALEEYGIESQTDPELEKATQEVYRAELHKGVMVVDEFEGTSVREARERIKSRLIDAGEADVMYDFSEKPVICRCGTECVVKILEDQWFLKYSDGEWKERAEELLERMEIIPKEVRTNFEDTIEWLDDWACARRVGLGTPLPWDQDWIVEPLSDSTVYMSYYTIAHRLKGKGELPPEVFDYVFLGEGDPERIAEETGLDPEELEAMREEFEYWYPLDWRLSAKDLVTNHLTFFIFHHAALFPEDKWPKGIVVFGMGLLEGQKMSSSKGNVVLLSEALDEYGPDVVRLFLATSAEPWQDFDWRDEHVRGVQRHLERFETLIRDHADESLDGKDAVDRWLLHEFREIIEETTEALEGFQIRRAYNRAFYGVMKLLREYETMKGHVKILGEITEDWLKLLHPVIPFATDRLWREVLGEDSFLMEERWPDPSKYPEEPELSVAKEVLDRLIEDVRDVEKVIGAEPGYTLHVYLAPEWQWRALELVAEGKEFGEVMSELMKDEGLRNKGDEVAKVVRELVKEDLPEGVDAGALREALAEFLEDAGRVLTNKTGASEVVVHTDPEEAPGPTDRKAGARPLRPGIWLEE